MKAEKKTTMGVPIGALTVLCGAADYAGFAPRWFSVLLYVVLVTGVILLYKFLCRDYQDSPERREYNKRKDTL